MQKTLLQNHFILISALFLALGNTAFAQSPPKTQKNEIATTQKDTFLRTTYTAIGAEKKQKTKKKKQLSVEAKKDAWANLIASHPYSNRPQMPKSEWRKIPKKDRPDLAAEQDYLMTMDPDLGRVPYERLWRANRIAENMLRNRAPIAGITWEERGSSNVGGRTRALMFDPNDATNKKVWAGAIGGGLWFTNDITVASPVWNRVDDFWNNIGISCIAYNPATPQEIYVGTGEGWGNADSQRGAGIWKTSNGGTTWAQLASTDPGAYNSGSHFHYINKIVIKSNGTIFAATKGYFVNAGGIMRSTDGGATWTRVLSVYTGAGFLYDWAGDLEVAANGDVFASFGVGSDGKVFKTTNASNGATGTWTDISTNVGIVNAQRIELACAPSNANVIYAVGSGGTGSTDVEWFKKSTNGGTTWSAVSIPFMVDGSGDHFTRSQSWYDLILTVHPTNANCIVVGGIDLHRSTDAGASWTGISHWYGGFGKPEVHADQHSMQFRPGASNEMIFGNDGGIFYSTNAGNTATTPSFSVKNTGYNVTQFYACATINAVNSNYFLAGAQDNGSQKFTQPQINATLEATGGDGAFPHIDQLTPNIQTTAYTNNTIYRSLDGGATFPQLISQTTGHFINPSEYDSQRKIFYAASNNNLLKRITGMNGTITDTDVAIAVGTAQVSTLKMSPYSDLLILGIETGRVYKYSNPSTGAPTLTRIDNGATPITATGWVSSIDIGANDNHILVSYSNYGVTSVWETVNGGTTWLNKEGNLPDMPIRSVLFNPSNRNQVLAATEVGVWSTDNFQTGVVGAPVWGPSVAGLANTRCDMLKYRTADKMVVLATHGRGLFTSDIFVTTSVADFVANPTTGCSGSLTVNFTDGSLKPNSSWAWDIDDNGTTDYITRNPTHTYSAAGIYSVKLTVNSGAATTTKTNLILVSNSAPTLNTGCTLIANTNLNNNFGIGIFNFTLANINNTTPNNDGFYQDYSCTQWTPLSLNTTYNATITTGTSNSEGAKVYIDYNDNGIFAASEQILSYPANNSGTRTLSFTTPASGVIMNKGLRMRVLSKFATIPSNPCDIGSDAQAEDYTVFFKGSGLPISLVSFTGKCDKKTVALQWETVTETNNDYFTVERSNDAVHFEPLGTVDAVGNSTNAHSYAFTDQNPFSEVTYYRLKQTDFSGHSEYFNTIAVFCQDNSEISIFPNPSNGVFTVKGFGDEADILIYNAEGKEIYNSKMLMNFANVNIGSNAAGVYNVLITTKTKTFTSKISLIK